MSKADSALDTLVRLIQVIGRDRALKRWFNGLSQMPAVQRRIEIFAMTEQMRARGEDADLVASFGLLADARVFDAACKALRERGFSDH